MKIQTITDADRIKKEWGNFNIAFWLIVVMKLTLGSYAGMSHNFGIWLLQIIPVLMMVCLIGYTSYKLSGRKLFILNGLLGLFWFLVIGILIGYFAVKRIKDYEIKKLKI